MVVTINESFLRFENIKTLMILVLAIRFETLVCTFDEVYWLYS